MSLWTHIARQISEARGAPFRLRATAAGAGGCINSTQVLEGEDQRYFVKLNDVVHLDMFEAEAEGLNEIAGTRSLRVPQPLCWGSHDGQAYLVLEYLDLNGGGARGEERLGHGLAALHRASAPGFGWRRDNTIGSTPQINTWTDSWPEFWRRHRLGYQLALAARRGLGAGIVRQAEVLLADLPVFFSDYRPVPSLLHGDLWSGNYAISTTGEPVIYDPAVYYGDREADLAMTELFGGFPARFYAAYRESWPLDPGYAGRKTLYNLYHILNHYNLFGGGYGSQAGRMIATLVGELR